MSKRSIPEHQLKRIGERHGVTTLINFEYVLIDRRDNRIHYILRALYQCDCGNKFSMHPTEFNQSCMECFRVRFKNQVDNRTRHGLCESPEYGSFNSMKARCLNPKVKEFNRYGGRTDPGPITICDRWLEPMPQGFINFYEDMGEKPEPKKIYTIDRINTNGNYEPSNCRWADKKTQRANTNPFEKMYNKICELCKIGFSTCRRQAKFCHHKCASKFWYLKKKAEKLRLRELNV